MTSTFLIRDEWDNGEFMTGATVDLIEDGKVVHTEKFVASSEDAPGEAFSAYGNGRDNHAGTQARSYAWAWIETKEAQPGDILGADGALIGRKDMSDREFLAPLLSDPDDLPF